MDAGNSTLLLVEVDGDGDGDGEGEGEDLDESSSLNEIAIPTAKPRVVMKNTTARILYINVEEEVLFVSFFDVSIGTTVAFIIQEYFVVRFRLLCDDSFERSIRSIPASVYDY